MSEILVGAIEPTAHEFGLSNVFVGVFVVAILGNAAEHATAISAALKDRMDLSLSIAIGSSVQVALFVAPVLVFASLFLGPAPMDLAFPAGLVLMVLLSVLITARWPATDDPTGSRVCSCLPSTWSSASPFSFCQAHSPIHNPSGSAAFSAGKSTFGEPGVYVRFWH